MDPYDWRRAQDHWGRTVGDTPIRGGEFYAIIDEINAKLDVLHDRVAANEDRLVEERAKHFFTDLVGMALTKGFVIVLAIVAAFLLTNYVHIPSWSPW